MRVHLTLPLLFALPGLAQAQLVVPGTTIRSVWTTADASNGVDDFQDVDFAIGDPFGAFAGNAGVTIGLPIGIATGGGSQDSVLEATHVSASGTCYASAESFSGGWLGGTWGISELHYEFTLTDKASYSLAGTIAAFDHGETEVRLDRLNHPFLVRERALGGAQTIAFDRSGVLEAGDYYFSITCEGSAVSAPGLNYASGEYDLTFDLRPLVENVCVAAPNSAGPGASLSLVGSSSVGANDFQLRSAGAPPGVSGLFFHGPNSIQVPFGDGFRCVGGLTVRLQPPVQHDASGVAVRAVDLGAGALVPNATRFFQLWYRDPMGPGGTAGSGFNMSDALRATFCP